MEIATVKLNMLAIVHSLVIAPRVGSVARA